MKKIHYAICSVIILISSYDSFAQSGPKVTDDNQISILFGLNQPVFLRGFNFEANYWMKHFVIDYSHGFGLHMDGEFVGGELDKQHLDLKVTNSLGVGVGYRVTPSFNVRIEPKIHFFELYYQDQSQTESRMLTDYSTFTLGVGAYYRWLPFEKKETPLKGLTVSPSIRYWPNVSSSLDDDKFTYANEYTGANETHDAAKIGLGDTPWIFNVSVGYTFFK